MIIQRKFDPTAGMTIPNYRAFLRSRPDEERWELIEGVPMLNATPVNVDQHVCTNLAYLLQKYKEDTGASWFATLGVGTHQRCARRVRGAVKIKHGP